MSLTTVFRILLIAFAALYVAAITVPIVTPASPPEVQQYEKWLKEQPLSGEVVWGLLVVLGHLLDLVGLVLLFFRRKLGVYLLVAGFIACLGAGTDPPYLQSNLAGMLMAFTNIAWGAIVALSFAVPHSLFKPSKEA